MPCARKLLRLIRPAFNCCGATSTMEPYLGYITNPTIVRNVNVFLLGLAFMLMFTAFQTMGNIEAPILNSAKNNQSEGYVPGFTGDGL